MTRSFPTLEERRAYCERPVTLNGRPALVSGAQRDYARITDKQTGLSAEWSWHAVRHVIENNAGAFQS